MATDTTVDIKDVTYRSNPAEVPVGGTVTWTNSDEVAHTATAQDRDVFRSGTLNPGDRFSHTFAAPGRVDYFCEFHPNMKGTIIVR